MINVFVVGLDSFNLELLQLLPSNENYAFKALLSYEEAVFRNGGEIDFPGILEMAEKPLAAASDSVDAIIGYWDFPTCSLVPILRQKQRLPGPRLEAVAACEHKYWSRMVQQSAIPEYVPRFCAVDPFDADPLSQIDMPYPFWIKPIKAHSSYLGFKIHDRTEFDVAIEAIRANIEHFAVPFDTFLSMVNVPANIANVRGRYCIAEEIISSAHQCTLEGYVFQGDVTVYGVVDSIREGKHHSCFSRYQYPSQIPQPVQNRMIEAAQQFLQYIGYSNATFNMEFFWEPSTNTIRLLEVNPRISKSHSPLFYLVDGAAHQKIDIDLCLGHKPDFSFRKGQKKIAAKFMLRVFDDGYVHHIPNASDLERLRQSFPNARARIMVKEGQRLAHMSYQDSYSYELAEIFLGADNEEELLEKHRRALELLPFAISPLSEGETG